MPKTMVEKAFDLIVTHSNTYHDDNCERLKYLIEISKKIETIPKSENKAYDLFEIALNPTSKKMTGIGRISIIEYAAWQGSEVFFKLLLDYLFESKLEDECKRIFYVRAWHSIMISRNKEMVHYLLQTYAENKTFIHESKTFEEFENLCGASRFGDKCYDWTRFEKPCNVLTLIMLQLIHGIMYSCMGKDFPAPLLTNVVESLLINGSDKEVIFYKNDTKYTLPKWIQESANLKDEQKNILLALTESRDLNRQTNHTNTKFNFYKRPEHNQKEVVCSSEQELKFESLNI